MSNLSMTEEMRTKVLPLLKARGDAVGSDVVPEQNDNDDVDALLDRQQQETDLQALFNDRLPTIKEIIQQSGQKRRYRLKSQYQFVTERKKVTVDMIDEEEASQPSIPLRRYSVQPQTRSQQKYENQEEQRLREERNQKYLQRRQELKAQKEELNRKKYFKQKEMEIDRLEQYEIEKRRIEEHERSKREFYENFI